MKRVIFCVGIFSFIVVLCVSTTVYFRVETRKMITSLDVTEDLFRGGDYENAYKKAAEVQNKWRRMEFFSDSFLNSKATLDIGVSISKLKPYIDSQNDEVYAELWACRELLERTFERA